MLDGWEYENNPDSVDDILLCDNGKSGLDVYKIARCFGKLESLAVGDLFQAKLLQLCCDVNAADNPSTDSHSDPHYSALHHAAIQPDIENAAAAQFLISHGATVDVCAFRRCPATGRAHTTPLDLAILFKCPNTANVLIRNGACGTHSLMDGGGYAPILNHAIRRGFYAGALKLLTAGADPNCINRTMVFGQSLGVSPKNVSPLCHALSSKGNVSAELVDLVCDLVLRGADPAATFRGRCIASRACTVAHAALAAAVGCPAPDYSDEMQSLLGDAAGAELFERLRADYAQSLARAADRRTQEQRADALARKMASAWDWEWIDEDGETF